MRRANDLEIGLDVLGAGLGIGDFVPWLGAIGKVAGGLAGGGGDDASKKAIEAAIEKEKQRQALERAQAEAAKTRMLMYGILGVVGVGVISTALILKKK